MTQWIKNCLEAVLRAVVNGSLSTGRAVKGGVPQGSVPGPKLFSIFVGALDSGTECTLSTFTDHSLCGAADTLQGRETIQRTWTGLKVAHASLMMFSKEEHKALCLGHGSPRHTCRVGGDVTESSPVENLVD